MALSKITFDGDGITDTFNVVFAMGFISEDDVSAYVVGEVDGGGNQIYRNITFLSDTMLQIDGDIPSTDGQDIVFERTVEKEELLVDYEDGDIMNENNLNTSQRQMIMAIHEALDGRLGEQAEDRNMGGFRLTNLGDPVDDTDAVTKQYVDAGIPGQVAAAVAARIGAENARDVAVGAAGTATTAAGTATTQAGISVGAASTAVDAANASIAAAEDSISAEGAAENSASEAAGSADTASSAASTATGAADTATGAAAISVTARNEAQGFSEDAEDARDDAEDARDLAYAWANNPEDDPVTESPDEYSAYHWAQKAAASAASGGGNLVLVDDYGAEGDGSTDDTAAFEAAFAALGTGGGTVAMSPNKRYVVGNISVPRNAQLIGPFVYGGRPGGNLNEDYNTVAALILTGTITMNSNTGFRGIMVMRQGTYPFLDQTIFAGTAFSLIGTQSQYSDIAIENCSIIGFNVGIVTEGVDRTRYVNLSMDCVNCIDISNSWDIPFVNKVHCWPFATISHPTPPADGQGLIRSGTALNIHSFVDWAKVVDFFAFGYLVGIVIDDANSSTLISCSVDNINDITGPLHSGSNGIIIAGTSIDTKLINCQAAAAEGAGLYIELDTSGQSVIVDGLSVWGGSTHGILNMGLGEIRISKSTIRNTDYGISTTQPSAVITLDESILANQVAGFLHVTGGANSNFKLGVLNRFIGSPIATDIFTVPADAGVPSITANVSATLPIPRDGDVFVVTGTQGWGQATGRAPGRKVTLIVGGTFSVFHSNDPSGIATPTGGTISATPNRVITMVSDGNRWFMESY